MIDQPRHVTSLDPPPVKLEMGRVEGLSVIIPTYNGAEWIVGALQSVLSQESPVPLEVVVVDDCSTDDTIRVVKGLRDARIFCYSTEKNSGVGAARNAGLRHSRFNWIAFNDQDDVWCPGRLVKQIGILERYSDIVGVAGGAARLAADGHSQWTGRFFGFRWTPMLRLKRANPPYYDPISDGVSYLQTLIVRKEIALLADGFLENLPLADDVDFAMKIARFGRFGWLDEPVFLYRLGQHNQTAPSVAKAKTFLAAHAYVQIAHEARSSGVDMPEVSRFLSSYQPSDWQIVEFEMRQKIRHINTVWVNKGFSCAVLVGGKVLFSNPRLFLQNLGDRLKYWLR